MNQEELEQLIEEMKKKGGKAFNHINAKQEAANLQAAIDKSVTDKIINKQKFKQKAYDWSVKVLRGKINEHKKVNEISRKMGDFLTGVLPTRVDDRLVTNLQNIQEQLTALTEDIIESDIIGKSHRPNVQSEEEVQKGKEYAKEKEKANKFFKLPKFEEETKIGRIP